MTDILIPENKIKEAINNSDEIKLIKDYFKEKIGRDAPEDVFNYMLELYKQLLFNYNI